ncbi:hypothetical protein C1H76_6195 [Elsinoe australis]|uniref:M protein, serotype 2.1 n=1 Tax=Elsinoe australis TaxID=40998 RepID=A0A4U7AUD3_9PEZI|nr:hypothetical protein C1H76_6195 [Elsinoe australis]
MSTPAKSQLSTAAAGRRPQKDTSTAESSPSRTPGKQATPSSNSTARSKPARTPGAGTPISARSAVKKPSNGSSNATNARNGSDGDGTADDDVKAQTAAAIEDLQERLRTAEESAEQYQKQITLLETRLESATSDQGKLEETVQELTERIQDLDNEKRDSLRSRRELEAIYESDRAASVKFRDESQAREDELQETIQRLKDSLAQRESRPLPEEDRKPSISRNPSFRSGTSPQLDGAHFAPSSSLHRSDSRSSSRLVLQKDKIIESLRIELAEAQIKLVEMENMVGGQVQELERNLMDTRMTNARLMEENESFQLLLSEKTLNGDLSHSSLLAGNSPKSAAKTSNLADELDNADGEGDDDDNVKQYKVRIASLTDENKALTLYINNIISRLLQHDIDFILDKDANPAAAAQARPSEKELPPPPPEKDEKDEGFLSRTMSVIGGRKPRPQSIAMPESSMLPTQHENPETAPSIPLGRPQPRSASGSHRRMKTDWDSAAVVNNMYRGPSPTRSGQLSPGITSPRNSFLGTRPSGGSRVASGSTVPTISESEKSDYVHRQQRDSKISSGRNSVASDTSRSASPPPSTIGGNSDKGASQSVMVGSKMRPLRLVQENNEEEAARKAANRTSWMGWFNQKGAAQ